MAAKIAGEKGKVLAVDIDASAIDKLKEKMAENGLNNVTAVVGTAEETIFCEKCADIVFYSIVLHDFQNPELVILNAKKMLSSSGKLIDLDWKKKQTLNGPPVRIRFSERQAQDIIEAAGFRVESMKDIGKDHYVITARLRNS